MDDLNAIDLDSTNNIANSSEKIAYLGKSSNANMPTKISISENASSAKKNCVTDLRRSTVATEKLMMGGFVKLDDIFTMPRVLFLRENQIFAIFLRCRDGMIRGMN